MARTSEQWQATPGVRDTHYIDNRIYTSHQIYEEEKRNIFAKVWQLVCHESELREVYSFRTLDLVGTPLILIRGTDNRIRCFLNACSHRGAKIVSARRGNARVLTCPFHLWAYDSAGRCTSITRPDASLAGGCKKDDLGLREIKAEVRKGLVFVCLDDHAQALDEYLDNCLEPLNPLLLTEPMEVYHYSEVIISANWKNWQEVNSELYHEYLHVINRRTSMTQLGYYDRPWTFHKNGHGTILGGLIIDYSKHPTAPKKRTGKVLPGLKPNEYMAIDLWPNVAFVVRDSGLRFDIVSPIAPNKTLIQFRALAPVSDTKEERTAREKDHNEFWGPFGRNVPEDIRAAVLQNQAMTTGQVPYSLIAREEGGQTQDEVTLRNYYAQWSRRMARRYNNIDLPASSA